MSMTRLQVLHAAENGSAQKLTLKGRRYWLDMQTAHAILTVYRALNETNRARYLRFDIPRMADIAWKLIAKQPVGEPA